MTVKEKKTPAELLELLHKELDQTRSINVTIVPDTEFVLRDANWDVQIGGYVDEATMKQIRNCVGHLRARYDVANIQSSAS